jgi:hypothetical protein
MGRGLVQLPMMTEECRLVDPNGDVLKLDNTSIYIGIVAGTVPDGNVTNQ